MEVSRSIASLREAHIAACNAQPCAAETGFFILAAGDLHADELSTLRALARVRLNADGRPLAHHVQELVEEHDRALEERQGVSTASLPADMGADIVPRSPPGEFAPTSGEFRFDVSALVRPTRPWINVLANPGFGAQISEAGGGYSWALNSRLNMLTPWSNDPVADPPGEWFLLQDTRTMQAWSVAPSAAGDNRAEYRVAHGQGPQHDRPSQRRARRERDLVRRSRLAVKQVRLRLINRGHRTINLRIVGIVEWILGANRADRGTTLTSAASQRAAPVEGGGIAGGWSEESRGDERRMTTLFCTQRDRAGGFGGGTAFFGSPATPRTSPTGPATGASRSTRAAASSSPISTARRAAAAWIPARRSPRASRCARATPSSAPSCSAGRRASRPPRRSPRRRPGCRR
jgi:cyclic beta-1,2-glucan synthetase